MDNAVDAVDANPGDGVCSTAGDQCTLRAAIQETNALAGADSITLPAGTVQVLKVQPKRSGKVEWAEVTFVTPEGVEETMFPQRSMMSA